MQKTGFEALSTVIVNTKHLEKLLFAKCHLTDVHFSSLANAVPCLKEIDMSKDRLITPYGFKRVCPHYHRCG